MNKYYRIEESKPNSDEPSFIICVNSDAIKHCPPKVYKAKQRNSSERLYGNHHYLNEWKDKLGDRLANLLGLSSGKRWRLKEFPKNYHLYRYSDPSLKNSAVLYGDIPPKRFWKCRYFISPDEFLLHLYWLCTNSREAIGKCLCQKCTSRPYYEVKAYLIELEYLKKVERLEAARNKVVDDDDEIEIEIEIEKRSKKAKIQEVNLFNSSQSSSIVVIKEFPQDSKEIETLSSGTNISQASQENQIQSEQSGNDITQASNEIASNEIEVPFPSSSGTQASVESSIPFTRSKRTQSSHQFISSASTDTQTLQPSRSRVTRALKETKRSTHHSSSQASLNPEPSSQYQFSIQPLDQKLKNDKSYQTKTHLINHDLIPSSLPRYRYLELVWFKLKETIEIPRSLKKEQKPIQIKLWPSIVLSLGSKSNENPKRFYIKLIGIQKSKKLVFDHELLPWRSYNYEKLRNQLKSQIEINDQIEENLIYENFEIAMTNLSYAIQISIHLHSIISINENESNKIQEENYDNQIWFGAEVLSIGDFVILNETKQKQERKRNQKSLTQIKEDEKTCKVMLIGEIQESNQVDENKNQLYKLTGHLFTTLITKKHKFNQIESKSKDNKNENEDEEIALKPYFKNQNNSSNLLKRKSKSGFEFDLVTECIKESGMKVKRLTNSVVGRMYSLNHLGKFLEPERIQNSSMSEVCGLKVQEEIQNRVIVPCRKAAISFAIQKAREEFEMEGFRFKNST